MTCGICCIWVTGFALTGKGRMMMADREKVIKGLERCKLYNKLNCDKCPYDYNGRGNGKSECTAELATDALALLEEQETVKPKKIKGYNPPMYTLYEYECEKCESPMMNKQPFCMGCGQEVKWE